MSKSRFAERGLLAVSAVLCILANISGLARADEPSGCDAFKWPLKHEADLLQGAGKPALASGAAASVDGKAYDLKLVALADAHLPQPPGRTPKLDPSTAGFLRYGAPSAGGVQITSTAAVWIDVFQNGKSVKPTAFTGARDCPGVRKSLRFSLAASPFVVEISGTSEPLIGIVAAPQQP